MDRLIDVSHPELMVDAEQRESPGGERDDSGVPNAQLWLLLLGLGLVGVFGLYWWYTHSCGWELEPEHAPKYTPPPPSTAEMMIFDGYVCEDGEWTPKYHAEPAPSRLTF